MARVGGCRPLAGRVDLTAALEAGLDLIRRGEYFAAHEELEDAWRAAEEEERDFFQGLVHVAVAWYQAGRGNRVGCERQLEKAARRLGPYAPEHRGVDVESILEQSGGRAHRRRRKPRASAAGGLTARSAENPLR